MICMVVFYDTVASGRFGTVGYLNMGDHNHSTCFRERGGWVLGSGDMSFRSWPYNFGHIL